MCGIIGYIGKTDGINKVINGLKALEYRGYDSAGIAYVKNNKVVINKEKGKIENLEKTVNFNDDTHLAIGHTRWATHGEATKTNAHPHQVGKWTIVHNGIIENYAKLKDFLIKKGYSFKSETDTEVACAIIDYYYKEEKDILKTLQKVCEVLKGSFSLGIICEDDYNHLYAIRKSSPLIVALEDNGNFIASDVPAILRYTNKYILLDDMEICQISSDKVLIYNQKLKIVDKTVNTFEGSLDSASKNGYEHFMLKEINEQDVVLSNTINSYYDGTIESLEKSFGFIECYNKIHIVACGSAYHAGYIGKYLIESFANIPVTIEVASEYRYKNNFYDKKTLVIVVSQSGETADTLAALRKAKSDGITTLAIINVLGSSIAREADHVIYTKAGCEIAVATTKAYLAQVSIFSLIALYLGIKNNIITNKEFETINAELVKLPSYIKKEINNPIYKKIADMIYKKNDIFYIGRNIDYSISLEGSLKLKEISYINSVAYQAGELKHGTISLIENGTPVIAIATNNDLFEKTISNIKEVKARDAYVILITNKIVKDKIYDEIIKIDHIHPILQALITVIPLQLIAYYVAYNRKCDIDKPRNLAKSVTVE